MGVMLAVTSSVPPVISFRASMRMLAYTLVALLLSINATAQSSTSIVYWSIHREQIEKILRLAPQDNAARLTELRSIFKDGECKGDLMRNQIVPRKHNRSGENLICSLTSENSKGTILVVAHYEHEGEGMSIVDNWSGAMMVPLLYFSLRIAPRAYHFVFVALDGKDGAKTYLNSLSKEEKRQMKAVIALDSLGVGDLCYYSITDFNERINYASSKLQAALIQAAFLSGMKPAPYLSDPQRWIGLDDTTEFRHAKFPVLTIHSISDPLKRHNLPRSKDDTITAIDIDKYYETYRALCVYLGYLDTAAGNLTK